MSNSPELTNDDIMALKGTELKEAAAAANIAGRSSMKASELREAIVAYWANRLTEAKDEEDTITESFYEGEVFPDSPPPTEKWTVQPNRAERRAAAARQRKARGRMMQKFNANNN